MSKVTFTNISDKVSISLSRVLVKEKLDLKPRQTQKFEPSELAKDYKKVVASFAAILKVDYGSKSKEVAQESVPSVQVVIDKESELVSVIDTEAENINQDELVPGVNTLREKVDFVPEELAESDKENILTEKGLKSKSRSDLKKIAVNLKIETKGTTDDIIKRILASQE